MDHSGEMGWKGQDWVEKRVDGECRRPRSPGGRGVGRGEALGLGVPPFKAGL